MVKRQILPSTSASVFSSGVTVPESTVASPSRQTIQKTKVVLAIFANS
jgi:hypothetical protein